MFATFSCQPVRRVGVLLVKLTVAFLFFSFYSVSLDNLLTDSMNNSSFNFKVGSLNIRGINKHSKRIAVFNWVKSKQFDIMFLQETYSAEADERAWQTDWGGNVYWSHGSKHSRGVCILVKEGFDLEVTDMIADINGRYIIMKVIIQGEYINLMNVYAPNCNNEKVIFFKELHRNIKRLGMDRNDIIIAAGDWNTIISANIDKAGGQTIEGETLTTEMKTLKLDLNLHDIWRLKNPLTKRYTFRQRNPLIQSRLDYFLISHCSLDMVEETHILASFCSDHSCISLHLSSLPKQDRGSGYWKFNASLIKDDIYVNNLNQLLEEWDNEYNYMLDKRIKWEMIKYKVRKHTIDYCKEKRRNQNQEINNLQMKMNELEIKLGETSDETIKNENYYHKNRLNTIEQENAEGAIIRSRVKWLEEGEKCTQYFFSLEKNSHIKKHIRKLQLRNNETITNSSKILQETNRFYETLYRSNGNISDENYDIFFDNSIPTLSNEEKEECDKEITLEEILETLKSFKNNKSPGNDGLTKEFYITFWQKLSKPLMECYIYNIDEGCMSFSQRQAVITLIEKPGKDRNFIDNWRPISLLNFDFKLLSKTFANRVKKVLPSIISNNQTAYVKDRSIEDSIRYVQDIIHYLNIKKLPGILLTVDFQKAFDTLEWRFISKALETFKFGPSFINLINMFYNDISSCIINNGTTSKYFKLERGVRQGNPLSPYLFIIAVGLLSIALMKNESINGIKVQNIEYKLTQYADDLTLTLSNTQSVNQAISLIEDFGRCSGLKLNKEKTEAMLLGSLQGRLDITCKAKIIIGPIKILGIYLSSDSNEIVMINFNSKIDALLRQLHWWKARDLSLHGRVLIIKTIALSKFQFLASLIHIPNNIVKQVNSIVYDFIWKSKTDKVKRSIFEQNFENGGYNMTNLNDIIVASSVYVD